MPSALGNWLDLRVTQHNPELGLCLKQCSRALHHLDQPLLRSGPLEERVAWSLACHDWVCLHHNGP